MYSLSGKTALVTGAASGLGLAIARTFSEVGARVILTDVNESAGLAAAKTLGDRACFRRLDVTSADNWAALTQEMLRDFGGLDVLVNNAGIALTGTIEQVDIVSWREIFRINCDGVMLGCKAAVMLMRAGGRGGSIVNIGSAAGKKSTSFSFAYAATKAAVISMTQGIALHCAQEGINIRCNVVNPGVIDTPIHDKAYAQMGGKEAAWEMLRSITPLRMIGQPLDIAHAVVYLASDAARFITGSALEVDGGLAIG